MMLVFCGLTSPELPTGHNVSQINNMDELNNLNADITVISDTVPGWQDIHNTDRCYLVSDNLSLEIIEAAERAGYAGVWTISEMPVRLAALLHRPDKRRPLDRAVPSRPKIEQSRLEPEIRPEPTGIGNKWEKHNYGVQNGQSDIQQHKRENYNSLPSYFPMPRQIIAFNSATGGKGKSTLTAATGIMLTIDPRIRGSVVAVDLDPFGSSLAERLGVFPKYSVIDFLGGAVDEVTKCLTPVTLPGADKDNPLMLLSGPKSEEDGVIITATVVQEILDVLQRRFDAVLVDTMPYLLDPTFVVLENAKHIFLVDIPDIHSLKKTYTRAHKLASLGMTNKLHFVLNRIPKQHVMNLNQVRDIPSSTEVIHIPDDIGISVASNKYEQICVSRRTAKFTSTLSGILEQIIPGYKPIKQKKRGVFSRLLGRKDVAF